MAGRRGFGVTIATSGNATFGGERMGKPASVASFAEKIAELDGMELVIGLDPNVMLERDDGDYIDAASLGLLHEFGFYNKRHQTFVPPRPFLEGAFGPHVREYAAILQKYASKSRTGANFAIKPITALAKQHLQEYLDDYPANGLRANTEATIEMKGKDHPLVNEGTFAQAAIATVIYSGRAEILKRRFRTAAQAEAAVATRLKKHLQNRSA